jgi:hypothetical protein
MNIKDIVKDNRVFFEYYRDGDFWYSVYMPPTVFEVEKYIFPVPIADIGTATMLAEDKAILFMRYIRRAMDNKTFIKK